MRGTIQYINPSNGMVAVLTTNGAFSVFVLVSGNAEVGDLVSWAGDCPLGADTVRNLTRNDLLDVVFENHDVAATQLGPLMGVR
jgi:hypothetical protein